MVLSTIPKCNKGGFPCLQTTGVTVDTTAVTFSFASHKFVNDYFQGFFVVKCNQAIPAGTTTTLPIQFTTTGVDNSTVPIVSYDKASVTVADWSGTGIYLFFYDRATGILQLMNI